MALVVKDRVKETTTTTGTGTLTLAGASSGFQSFAAIGNGNQTYYVITDVATGDWEVGIGTYTSSGTTLSRTTVLSSSNGGTLVPLAAGVKDVFVAYPAERAVYLDTAGVVAQLSFGAITATSVAMTTGTITTPPTNNTDIVNKQYADAIASGINFHQAVEYATTAALPAVTYNNGTGGVGATLTANANGALTVDGYTFVSPADNGTRILIKNQANGAQNGVYTLTQAGNSSPGAPFILTRATDFDSVGTGVDQIDEGDFFLVTSGTANTNTAWVQQTPLPITIGTTAIVFQQFSAPITYTAGTGLSESPSYTFNIANVGTAGTYGTASQVPVFVTNAQGQVTSVTNTNIAINGSAVSGNITGSAGSVANSLTAGTYLTGSPFNGSSAQTWTVDATSANTASKVVARDASGNFSAGTITATLSGNATTATTATNIAGGAANQIHYQTGAGATSFIVAPTASGQVLSWNGSAFAYVAGTISGVSLGSNLNSLTAGTYLTGTAYNGSAAQTWAVDATSANTASKVVARDASGNFSAGTITATLSGNASTATSATTATNLAGGVAGALPYQSGAGTTLFTAAGTSGQYLQSNGTTAPTWVTPPTIGNGTLTMAVSGTGLSGSATFTANQSGNSTFTVTSNATSANTASAIVARDASGNFSAGTITASLSGTATQVSNSLTLATSGTGLSGSATFNGATAQTFTVTSNATSANTASTIVARDASGNFSAGTITASLSGTATTATTANALNASNSYTVAGLTVSTAGAYIVANRTSSGSGQVGYNWAQGGANLWWNYVDTGATTLSWYNSVTSTNVMTLTTGGALSAASFSGAGTGLTGTASSLSIGGNAATATTATNIAGGGAGRIPYNTGSGTTAFVAVGTAGQVLQSNGTSAPSWVAAPGPQAGGVIYENALTITSSYTLTAGRNGMSVGPITISSGAAVTVPSGQRWIIF